MDKRRWTLILYSLFGLVCIPLLMVVISGQWPIHGSSASAAPAQQSAPGDWPQLARDPQRTNYSPQQVNPPYCYIWKWYEVPFASRAQPVVVSGRLFIGGMDGVLYARNASTGASLWTFPGDGSPIRHSAGVMSDTVVFSTHAGNTFALNAADGVLRWQRYTGPSATAPLMDPSRGWVYVASTNGTLTALRLSDGAVMWQHQSDAPILTTPALSRDGSLVFAGNEAIYAFAVDANTGALRWKTRLYGQSLSERYPVVLSDTVIYRSQSLYPQPYLLAEGDEVMDQAGPVNPDWDADWNAIQPFITAYLAANPHKQTLFVLDTKTGITRGVAPVLYTFGDSDVTAPPVVRAGASYTVYLAYRPRQGIQTTGGSVHVSSRYDAEIGLMRTDNLSRIVGLRTADYPQSRYSAEFRLTSDEPAILTMGGNILLVDNWERLGGISLTTPISGQLIHIGHVSNVWPECGGGPGSSCGPEGPNPFFPLSGNPADPAYPFPPPRSGEGVSRGGAVVANNMIYWRVLGAGLAGIGTRPGPACPPPLVYTRTLPPPPTPTPPVVTTSRPLTDYVTLDLTTPVDNPPPDLVARLRDEVRVLVSLTPYPMPYVLQRGQTNTAVWPHNASNTSEVASISFFGYGNAVWHDSGELLLTLAMAYPYLDPALQVSVTQYVSSVVALYPPWEGMPWGNYSDWMKNSAPREYYPVPEDIRQNLNNWPPVAASPISLYAVWLWAKNTGDWSVVRDNWAGLTQLYQERLDELTYYADFAGPIGYARMARQLFGSTSPTYTQAVSVAVAALQAGRVITPYIDYARSITQHWAPRDEQPEWGNFYGWHLPVFYGLTPEIGLYLREQTNGLAAEHVIWSEGPNGMRWWFLTRAGLHAEEGESAFLHPLYAWSHFLAHAYILGDNRETLRRYLDRPWGRGDLYSIQKIVATIQAPSGHAVYLPVVMRNSR
ncbi:MAG: PQQ-binding-like beta-propeller repeat protein [Anaerolineae bacterium]|nr:PQQ-binding-like beta-propeller repeat protein [Anaerolineae bacterium]